MSATVLYMSMSLDGFITGPNDGRGNGLGVDGHRLHDWLVDGGAPDWPLVTYVTDVATAMARAKDAAGDRDVLVHGARTAQLALAAGVLDELEIHQIPVLLGQGRRLFDHLGPDHIELELARIVDAPGVTHLRYRVRR
jgi:dihydrofolate reductase